MKKLLIVLTSFVILTPSITQVIACSPDDILRIAFVPSINSVEVMNAVRPLETKLAAEIHRLDPAFSQKVNIQTTTSYESAGQALEDGKVGLAFLPMGTYTKYWGDKLANGGHSDLAPLVVAQRWAMKPDAQASTLNNRNIDFKQSESILDNYYQDAKEVINKSTAQNSLYTNSTPISFYRSEILANNNFLQENNVKINTLLTEDETTYKATMKNLVKKAVADGGKFNLLMSDTSGAGVIYPLQWLIDIGFNPKTKEGGDLIRQILYSPRATSYSVAAQDVSTQTFDMTIGYTDIRADMTSDNDVKNAYDNSSIVGITNGIYNDGISYSKSVIKDSVLLDAIRHAFKNLIEDSANKKIFSVYQHTDYEIPNTPQDSAAWEASYDKKYQDNMDNLKTVYDILNDY